MPETVKLVLVASGSGTDADSIMQAWKKGFIPEVSEIELISTKRNAGCIEKADALKVPNRLIEFDPSKDRPWRERKNHFMTEMRTFLYGSEFDLLFAVGCDKELPPVPEMGMYNIHPAEPTNHGGYNMFGIFVHEHVLSAIIDELSRRVKNLEDRFFTFPTVHELVPEIDQGRILMQCPVEIPHQIIEELFRGQIVLREAAEKMQQYVLPFEWMMLPTAVRMAARKIIVSQK